MEQVHLRRQASPISTDQPAFALNPFVQILQVGTGPTRGVAAGQHHSARQGKERPDGWQEAEL